MSRSPNKVLVVEDSRAIREMLSVGIRDALHIDVITADTLATTKKIISKQASREERLSIADDVILNNRTLDSLKEEVIKLHKKYIKMLNHG